MDDRRYHGLDALRGGMMMLGIVLHGALLYLTAPPPGMPMLTDPDQSVVFDHVFGFIHAFRMPTFFVVAGFFTALLVGRRGTRATLRDRARRILAPLAAGFITLLPLTGLLMIDFWLAVRFGTHNLWPNRQDVETLARELEAKGAPHGEIPIAHLWFLYYLCAFYLLIPACRWLEGASRRFEAAIRAWLASPLAILPLAACTAATLWPFQGAQVHEGFVFLRPHLPSLAYYGFFFVFGYLLHAHRDALGAMARRVPLHAVLGAGLFPLATWAAHVDHFIERTTASHAISAVLNGLCTWAIAFLAIGLAQRWFDRESPWIQYVSQSAYWVYLVHMPLVLFAGWLLVPYRFPAELKFVLVCLFTATLSLASFQWIVQSTWIGVFLHGKRLALAWPWRAGRS